MDLHRYGKKYRKISMILFLLFVIVQMGNVRVRAEVTQICGDDEILCITDGNGYEARTAKYFDCYGNKLGEGMGFWSGKACTAIKIGTIYIGKENGKYAVYEMSIPIRKIAEYPMDKNTSVTACEGGYLVCNDIEQKVVFYNAEGEEEWNRPYSESEEKYDLIKEYEKDPYVIYWDTEYSHMTKNYVPYGGTTTNPITGESCMERWVPYEDVDGGILVSVDDQKYMIPLADREVVVGLNTTCYLLRKQVYFEDLKQEWTIYCVGDLQTGEIIKTFDKGVFVSLGYDYYYTSMLHTEDDYYMECHIYLADGTDVVEKYKITGTLYPWRKNLIYVRRGPYMGLVNLEGKWVIKELCDGKND